MPDTDKARDVAHELILIHGDADSSPEELYDLLIQHFIPDDIAYEVILEVRGAGPPSRRRKK